MRASQYALGINPQPFKWGDDFSKIFMVKNRSSANTIYIQFGHAPGNSADAWPLGAGETFTLDPAAPKDTIWLWADVNSILNTVLMG